MVFALITGREAGCFTRPEDPGAWTSSGQFPGRGAGISRLWMSCFEGHVACGGMVGEGVHKAAMKWESNWEGWDEDQRGQEACPRSHSE